MSRRKLVAGNWKMHGSITATTTLVKGLLVELQDLRKVEVAVCPPYPYLAQVRQLLAGSSVMLGAQDVCEKAGQGAFTGEVSGQMLTDNGCTCVIIGHSERRQFFDDTDARVAAKFMTAQAAGLL